MNNRMLRVGALGAGQIFTQAHLPVYATLDEVELTAIYDPDRSRAEAARARYVHLRRDAGRPAHESDVHICATAEALIADVDVVDICSPPRYHALYACMALSKGVHVMTEKPMARTWWEARQVVEAARQSKAYFQLNDDNPFLPRYRALRNVIEDGMIGEVQTIWIARGYHGPEERGDWFWDPLENGGGAIMDYGSHAVTSVWFLVGYEKQPTEVRSLGIECRQRLRLIGGRFRRIEVDDDAHFKIRFLNPQNGDWATAIIEATWAWPELGRDGSDVHGYLEVEGSKGTVTAEVDAEGREILRVRRRAFGERLIFPENAAPEDDSFRLEITNFVRSIQAGIPSLLNADIAAAGIGILNAALLSEMRGRRAVTLQEVADFCQEQAVGAPDVWQGGDQIARALYRSFRAS